MIPNIVSGQAIGTSIAVANSTDLSLLSSQGMALGTKAYNIALSSYFTLTASTASLVTNQVVAVEGVSGQRWILDQGANPPWKAAVIRYASPLGDDANDGKGWNTPKLTGYAAYQQLGIDSGGQGGILECASGTSWGGPVANQGVWLRGDGLDTIIPGWLPVMPVTIRGHGGKHTQFSRPCGGLKAGINYFAPGTGDRFHPFIWLVASGTHPVIFRDLLPDDSNIANQVGRFGWDFRRNVDGTVAFANITQWVRGWGEGLAITSAARTSNVTRLNFLGNTTASELWVGLTINVTSSSGSFPAGVYTVSNYDINGRGNWLEYADPGSNASAGAIGTWAVGVATATVNQLPGVAITSAARSNATGQIITRLNFTNPGNVGFASLVGVPFTLTSSDVNFPSGDYVISSNDTHGSWIEYHDSGANHSSGAIGTWATHWVNARDRIEVVSVSSEVPSTDYRVRSVTATTITVTDPYGYSTRSATVTVANPGQYVLQDRANYSCGLLDVENVNGGVSPNIGLDPFSCGPTFDFGATTDGRITVTHTACTGLVPVTRPAPPDRSCWLLADAGAAGAAGLIVKDSRPAGGGIRIYGSTVATYGITTDNVQNDTAIDIASPPALEVLEGGSNGVIVARDTVVFDNQSGSPDIRTDANPATVFIKNCGTVSGQALVESAYWNSTTRSALAKRQTGFWLGRVAGDSPQPRRAFSPLTARYQNWAQNDPATWNLAGAVCTAAATDGPQAAPGSLSPAWRLTRVSGPNGLYITPQDINNNPHTSSAVTHAVGDRWIIGSWLRSPSGSAITQTGQVSFSFAGANGNFSVSAQPSFQGDGEWVWCASGETIKFVDSAVVGWRYFYFAEAGRVGSQIDVMDPLLIRIPAGDMTDNEFAEYVLGIQSTPYYLAPGLYGTRPGQQLIGHGGLGSARHYVSGVGSGQITVGAVNGKFFEVFDESGASLGVFPLSSFTINP